MKVNYLDVQAFGKIQAIIKAVEGSDLVGREFTRKEFIKVFHNIVSLKWITFYGFRKSDGKVGRGGTPFVKLARVEFFEMPYDSTIEKNVAYVNGEKCPDIYADKFNYDKEYRKMCRKCYGDEIEIRQKTSETFTAKRNFYTIDLDLLKKARDCYKPYVKDYYAKRITKYEQLLAHDKKAYANTLI